jgi:hypothetical protein
MTASNVPVEVECRIGAGDIVTAPMKRRERSTISRHIAPYAFLNAMAPASDRARVRTA